MGTLVQGARNRACDGNRRALSRLVSRAARSGPTPGAADGLYRESAADSESHGRGHDRQATEGGMSVPARLEAIAGVSQPVPSVG